jgi:tRNA (mo5U34)-methyltransferase
MSVQAVAAQWAEMKKIKSRLSEEFEKRAATGASLSQPIPPLAAHLSQTTESLIRHRVAAEPYWFQKIELFPGFFSPGWSDPVKEKLPFFGLPEDLRGRRVLDIGCAEGFFSFEAERRGAREVIAIDSFPDSIRRFNIVRDAKQSNATAYLTNVYDLKPSLFGTFDIVLFYGVFYHLKHPQKALESIRSICAGDLIFQTLIYEEPAVKGTPWARFFPHGYMSGTNNDSFDVTVFWLFNSACCIAMLDHLGFVDIEIVSDDPQPFVLRCGMPDRTRGKPPDQTQAPWC